MKYPPLTPGELIQIRGELYKSFVSRMHELTPEEWNEFGEWWEDGDPELRFTQSYLEAHYPGLVVDALARRTVHPHAGDSDVWDARGDSLKNPPFRVERWSGLPVLTVMAAPAEFGAELQSRIEPLFTGIGPVEGAVAMTATLARMEAADCLPGLIVSLGSCGSATLENAATYQVASVSYRDMDCSPLGFEKGVTPLSDLPAVLPLPCPIPDWPTARLSTGGNVISGAAYGSIDADMVDMETWALVRAAQTFGVPLVALRGVSDGRAELKALEDWTSTLAHVDQTLAAALDQLSAVIISRGLSALEVPPAPVQDPRHPPAVKALP
jgi:adenosylhomocysteine nucleosidase